MTDRMTRLLSRWAPIHQWFKKRPLATDGALAALVVALSSTAFWFPETFTEQKLSVVMTSVWLVVGAIPVVIRRVWLWWATAILIGLLIGSFWDNSVWLSASYSILIISYTIAKRPLRSALAGNAALWMVASFQIAASSYSLGYRFLVIGLLFNYMLAIICFSLGRWVGSRQRKDRELEEQAREAEANQALRVTEAINDERRRIARELHDVVAHHLSVMNVMAAGARRTLHTSPEQAAEALETIETTGRTTLREMRRLLQVLRTDAESSADDEQLTPQPDLDSIHRLVSQIRSAGLAVNLTVDGEPRPLDPGVALTIYRIIQEGLTNTLKHAGPARARVWLRFTGESLELEVSDTGAGPKTVTTGSGRVGHGLVGMRERVSLYGGTLRTGPRPGGGFRIHAMIPIDALTAGAEAG